MLAFDSFTAACNAALDFARIHNGTLEEAELYIKRHWGKGTFGIEQVECAERILRYINTVDTYSMTIGEENGDLFVTTWGGWYEEAENLHCVEEGVIRCGNCGAFTPVAECWHETVCEHCGRYVDSGELPDSNENAPTVA